MYISGEARGVSTAESGAGLEGYLGFRSHYVRVGGGGEDGGGNEGHKIYEERRVFSRVRLVRRIGKVDVLMCDVM